jgi:CubicO group peptidase (beta-lactamase class C family)
MRFALMLLKGGEFNGVRFLSPSTITFMTSDHLGSIPQHDLYHSLGPGFTYGLGFGVRIEPGMANFTGSVGYYYWGGAAGTIFWNDPQKNMMAMLLIQDFAKRLHYKHIFHNLVYQALID